MSTNPVIIHMRNIGLTDKMIVEACRQAIRELEDTVFEQANPNMTAGQGHAIAEQIEEDE